MKYSMPSILLVTAAWTVQAVPTAVPSMGGRARGLPYNVVRSIHSQRKFARQESTAAGNTPVPDVTSVLDIPTSDPLPPTSVAIVTSEPTAITSDANVPTSEPLPPATTDVITSEPTAITSVPGIPTTEPLPPPTTTDVITSEPITVLQTFRVKVRQGTVTPIPTQVETPIETIPVDSPTAVPGTPIETVPVDSPTGTAVPATPAETIPVDSPTAIPATPIIDIFVARSPYTDTVSPPTTTS